MALATLVFRLFSGKCWSVNVTFSSLGLWKVRVSDQGDQVSGGTGHHRYDSFIHLGNRTWNFTMTPLCCPGSRVIPDKITKLVWNNTKVNHTAGWIGWIWKVRAGKWGRRLAGLPYLEKLFIVKTNHAACPAPIDSLWFLREQYIKNLSVFKLASVLPHYPSQWTSSLH